MKLPSINALLKLCPWAPLHVTPMEGSGGGGGTHETIDIDQQFARLCTVNTTPEIKQKINENKIKLEEIAELKKDIIGAEVERAITLYTLMEKEMSEIITLGNETMDIIREGISDLKNAMDNGEDVDSYQLKAYNALLVKAKDEVIDSIKVEMAFAKRADNETGEDKNTSTDELFKQHGITLGLLDGLIELGLLDGLNTAIVEEYNKIMNGLKDTYEELVCDIGDKLINEIEQSSNKRQKSSYVTKLMREKMWEYIENNPMPPNPTNDEKQAYYNKCNEVMGLPAADVPYPSHHPVSHYLTRNPINPLTDDMIKGQRGITLAQAKELVSASKNWYQANLGVEEAIILRWNSSQAKWWAQYLSDVQSSIIYAISKWKDKNSDVSKIACNRLEAVGLCMDNQAVYNAFRDDVHTDVSTLFYDLITFQLKSISHHLLLFLSSNRLKIQTPVMCGRVPCSCRWE